MYSPPPVMSRRREECRTSEKSNVHRYQSPTVNTRMCVQADVHSFTGTLQSRAKSTSEFAELIPGVLALKLI